MQSTPWLWEVGTMKPLISKFLWGVFAGGITTALIMEFLSMQWWATLMWPPLWAIIELIGRGIKVSYGKNWGDVRMLVECDICKARRYYKNPPPFCKNKGCAGKMKKVLDENWEVVYMKCTHENKMYPVFDFKGWCVGMLCDCGYFHKREGIPPYDKRDRFKVSLWRLSASSTRKRNGVRRVRLLTTSIVLVIG